LIRIYSLASLVPDQLPGLRGVEQGIDAKEKPDDGAGMRDCGAMVWMRSKVSICMGAIYQ